MINGPLLKDAMDDFPPELIRLSLTSWWPWKKRFCTIGFLHEVLKQKKLCTCKNSILDAVNLNIQKSPTVRCVAHHYGLPVVTVSKLIDQNDQFSGTRAERSVQMRSKLQALLPPPPKVAVPGMPPALNVWFASQVRHLLHLPITLVRGGQWILSKIWEGVCAAARRVQKSAQDFGNKQQLPTAHRNVQEAPQTFDIHMEVDAFLKEIEEPEKVLDR